MDRNLRNIDVTPSNLDWASKSAEAVSIVTPAPSGPLRLCWHPLQEASASLPPVQEAKTRSKACHDPGGKKARSKDCASSPRGLCIVAVTTSVPLQDRRSLLRASTSPRSEGRQLTRGEALEQRTSEWRHARIACSIACRRRHLGLHWASPATSGVAGMSPACHNSM